MSNRRQLSIPSQIKVGGQIIQVKTVKFAPNNNLGTSNITSGEIFIADCFKVGDKEIKVSDTSQINTFLHEVIHAILDTMGEFKLSSNEKFVSCFSGFLTEAIGCKFK